MAERRWRMINIDIRKFVRDRDWIGFAYDQVNDIGMARDCEWYYRCNNKRARQALSLPLVWVITFIVKMLNRMV